MGQSESNFIYTLLDSEAELIEIDLERDFRRLMGFQVKAALYCAAAMKKASSLLRIIKKGIENKTANIVMPLYPSLAQLRIMYTAFIILQRILLKSSGPENNNQI